MRELSAENDDMDDYIVVDGDQLDLDELVLSDILLSLPTKNPHVMRIARVCAPYVEKT